jgi:transposase InsO family protein
VIPDLVRRDLTAPAPGVKLVGDITYIHTWEGWLYLATVIDCHTKAVVGWSMADHYRTPLINAAITMAAGNIDLRPGCIFHSDRGSNYTSSDFARTLRSLDAHQSVGRTGVCWDNAMAESFFGALKIELVYRTSFATPCTRPACYSPKYCGFLQPQVSPLRARLQNTGGGPRRIPNPADRSIEDLLTAIRKTRGRSIRPGLNPTDFTETLRHETVHSVLTPRTPGLTKVTLSAYQHSHLWRYAEEAAAEGYGTRSLSHGLRFPLDRTNPYDLSPLRIGGEAVALTGGLGGIVAFAHSRD